MLYGSLTTSFLLFLSIYLNYLNLDLKNINIALILFGDDKFSTKKEIKLEHLSFLFFPYELGNLRLFSGCDHLLLYMSICFKRSIFLCRICKLISALRIGWYLCSGIVVCVHFRPRCNVWFLCHFFYPGFAHSPMKLKWITFTQILYFGKFLQE